MANSEFPRCCQVALEREIEGSSEDSHHPHGQSQWSTVYNVYSKFWYENITSQGFFSKTIPLGVKREVDRDRTIELLRVTIIRDGNLKQNGANGAKPLLRQIRVQVEAENNPSWAFYTIIGSGAFEKIRQDQNLRVDFESFPSKVIGLFNDVIYSTDEKRLTAHLDVTSDGSATVALIQSTEFRELVHLCLSLDPLTGHELSRHLVGELKVWSSFGESLVQYVVRHWREFREDLMRHKARINDLDLKIKSTEDALKQSEENKALEFQRLEARHCKEMDASAKEHNDLANKVQTLTTLLTRKEAEIAALSKEVNEKSNVAVEASTASEQREREFDEVKSKLNGALTELEETRSVVDLLGKQLREAEPLLAESIEKEKQLNASCAKVQHLSVELDKANGTISHLTSRGRSMKSQCKDLQNQVSKLQSTVADLKDQNQSCIEELSRSRNEINSLKLENSAVTETLGRLQKEIKELEGTLNAKNQLLDYLNRQANEREIAASSTQRNNVVEYPCAQTNDSWVSRTGTVAPTRSLSPAAILAIRQAFPDRPVLPHLARVMNSESLKIPQPPAPESNATQRGVVPNRNSEAEDRGSRKHGSSGASTQHSQSLLFSFFPQGEIRNQSGN